eukprot:73312-Alexandrium_andersonii.AAC.1
MPRSFNQLATHPSAPPSHFSATPPRRLPWGAGRAANPNSTKSQDKAKKSDRWVIGKPRACSNAHRSRRRHADNITDLNIPRPAEVS